MIYFKSYILKYKYHQVNYSIPDYLIYTDNNYKILSPLFQANNIQGCIPDPLSLRYEQVEGSLSVRLLRLPIQIYFLAALKFRSSYSGLSQECHQPLKKSQVFQKPWLRLQHVASFQPMSGIQRCYTLVMQLIHLYTEFHQPKQSTLLFCFFLLAI